MHIALTFNLRQDSACAPSNSPSVAPLAAAEDLYAEWDDFDTIDAVRSALSQCHRVSLVEADHYAFASFQALRPDLVFNMAEGLLGASREAQIPALLDMLGLPYTGSDPLTLGNCLDKRRTKEILSYHRVPTPRFALVESLVDVPARLRYPLIVKPILEGSSKGVTDRALVTNRKELLRQVEWSLKTYRQPVLIEEFLPGREFTVALLGNGESLRILPVVEIDFAALPAGVNPIYSFEAKWIWDTEEQPLDIFACPAPLDPSLHNAIERVCKKAFQVMGCRDWCRIDVRLDASGQPNIIELNPLPGVLPRPEQNSCFPKAARAAGLSYDELILGVADAAIARHHLVKGVSHADCCLL
ncbi:D-alanine--D-alanine ligase [Syntrophotalea acetylenivorans]|uniref:D-alanine--D-alanine ligase n=1 Tax=Syntrophotalea acetylenivorans TaxID=1842532 RepID=A0A1L3GLR0_9BACT|nr:ATP-grasp domain-containing protein [Syntrophotalea acetylenivorans]APG26862.1 D-alanine--D-alanine ligase [Syntrophotalea acetylenivorans]